MTHHKIFIFCIAILFVAIALVLDFMPRPTFSENERRELAEFPEFSLESLRSGQWTSDISAWFSDTEPFRDQIMTLSNTIQGYMALRLPSGDDDDNIVLHASLEGDSEAVADEQPEDDAFQNPKDLEGYESHIDENAKIASRGIMIVGSAPNARALMIYGGSGKMGIEFANAANRYHDELGATTRIYCMPIPNSGEFYCPDKARDVMKPQIATINNIFANLKDGVIGVDCYTPLSQHTDEPIFLRTDHHWAPRGAYYAAQAFAKTAGVPFRELDTYEQHVIHNFVGTMYGYSKDISIKQSPEDFVYYTPTDVEYTTTYIEYTLDKAMRITGMGKPKQGKFFYKYSDGSGSAYSTFMGGDKKITQIRTSTRNGRRLMILKDSFGNALPGYLFHSFEEIHVVDCRYFTHNIKSYVNDNAITDLLFANNTFKCCGNGTASSYIRFLTQASGVHPSQSSIADKPATETDKKAPVENNKAAQSVNPTSSTLTEPAKAQSTEPDTNEPAAEPDAPATVNPTNQPTTPVGGTNEPEQPNNIEV